MSKVQLKIRRMQTGEDLVAELESVDDALAWLAQRPPFVEVVRVQSEVDDATESRLRAAMRPFDDEERAWMRKQDFLREADRKEELARLQAEALAAEEPTQPRPNPARPMDLAWTRGEGLRLADPKDDREIPEAARRVIGPWLRERDGWLHERRQHLAQATFSVWPAEVPSGGESARIIDADFSAGPGFSDVEIE